MTRFGAIVACVLAAAVVIRPAHVEAQDETSLGTPDTCKFPFMFRNVWWNTCTSLGGSQPWCVLKDQFKPPPPANDWLNCDMSKFSNLTAFVDGKRMDCEPRKVGNDTFTGCSGTSNQGPYTCEVVGGSVGVCSTTKTQIDGSKQGGYIQGMTSGDSNAGSPASSGGSAISTGGIVGLVASVGAVALLAGLFVYRRRQSKQNLAWSYQNKGMEGEEGGAATAGFSAAAAAAAGCRESTVSSQMFSPVSPGERLYPVVSTYTPTLGDELEIQPGDKVGILIEYDDGWCQGINHTRGGLKGVFPRHCVDMTAGVPVSDPNASTLNA